MNFLSAIKHAAIGYGIRRKAWHKMAILSLDTNRGGCELYWLDQHKDGGTGEGGYCRLVGPDKAYDLQVEDITAQDWETV